MESSLEKHRKRQRNPSEWKREKRKRLRIAGMEYVNSKGEVVAAKQIGSDCNCRRKCFSKITEQERRLLFDGYYSLHSHDEQNAYLYGLIQKYDIARKKKKSSERRTCTYKYFLRIQGKQFQVCRLAFANIHGISPHKIRILCQKLDKNIMFPRDQRGKHGNRPKRIPDSILNCIKNHIYSIIKSDQIQNFLRDEKGCSNPDVNITKMWKDYLEKHDEITKSVTNFDEDSGSSIPHLHLPDDMRTLNTNSNASDLDHFNLETGGESDTSVETPLSFSNLCRDDHYIENTCSLPSYTSSNDEPKFCEGTKLMKEPKVKHWLYSKVFHEEFKFLDILSLKKKLSDFKINSEKLTKGERKQRTPKKILKNERSVVENCLMLEQPAVEDGTVLFPSRMLTAEVLTNLNSAPANGVILPANLQALTPLNIIVPNSSTQFMNLQAVHTYPNYSFGLESCQGNFVNVSTLSNISFAPSAGNCSSTYVSAACYQ